MLEIAEKFCVEYSNILEASIGAAFIQHEGKWEIIKQITDALLSHHTDNRFPQFSDMKSFFNELWYAKEYSRVLRFHFNVDFDFKTGFLYYKGFIQTLEIRRVKFKDDHTHRCLRFFKDIISYTRLANEIFEHNQKVSGKPLTPYEYILFH